jgi:hypothetical protein
MRQIRQLHGATGPAGTHLQGRWLANATIGIPTFADKGLQRAVAMVLEATYEQDFLDCSMAFGPDTRRIRRHESCKARR